MLMHELYRHKLLKFFELSSSETKDISVMLLEGIIDMIGESPVWDMLPIGARVEHPDRGVGRIKQILPDGRRKVKFDVVQEGKKAECRYNADSMAKLRFDLHDCTEDVRPLAGTDSHFGRALLLCVTWDMPELVHKVLGSTEQQPPEGGCLPEVSHALQRALELQRQRVVEVLLRLPGVSVETVSMCHLYMQPDADYVLSGSRALQAELATFANRDMKLRLPKHVRYQHFQRATMKEFRSVSDILHALLFSHKKAQPHDVLFWLAYHGNLQMAQTIWKFTELPIHVALLGFAICNRVASQLQDQPAVLARRRAKEMEQWAYGALTMARTEEQARSILSLSITPRQDCNAIEIAYRIDAKRFLLERNARALIDHWWRGGFKSSAVTLSPDFSWGFLVIQTLFPPLNVYAWHPRKKKEASYQAASFLDEFSQSLLIQKTQREASR
eukprot:6589131-Prymnesium_polylepis.1